MACIGQRVIKVSKTCTGPGGITQWSGRESIKTTQFRRVVCQPG